jgi:hypothetical protein
MEPTLTEFSYGYCVTEEFANGNGPRLRAAPYFPSLYTEGQLGGGFDVRVGNALFLQFKLCEELTRRSAKETQAGLIEPPFYRFWLHRRNRSNQHQMLIDLESQPGNQVYYIAPGFADLDALNASYISRRVVAKSAMFSPTEIGPLPDDAHHRVAFRSSDPDGWFMSEPRPIRIHREENVVKLALRHEADVSAGGAEDWLYRMAALMKGIIYRGEGRVVESLPSVDQIAGQRDPLHQVAYLARAYFSCEVLFAAVPR